MDKVVETLLATSVVLMTIGVGMVQAQNVTDGLLTIGVGVSLVFVRGYLKQ